MSPEGAWLCSYSIVSESLVRLVNLHPGPQRDATSRTGNWTVLGSVLPGWPRSSRTAPNREVDAAQVGSTTYSLNTLPIGQQMPTRPPASSKLGVAGAIHRARSADPPCQTFVKLTLPDEPISCCHVPAAESPNPQYLRVFGGMRPDSADGRNRPHNPKVAGSNPAPATHNPKVAGSNPAPATS